MENTADLLSQQRPRPPPQPKNPRHQEPLPPGRFTFPYPETTLMPRKTG